MLMTEFCIEKIHAGVISVHTFTKSFWHSLQGIPSMKNYWLLGFTLCLLAFNSINAESYVSVHSGFVVSHSEVDVDVYDNNQPTYCDSLLYPDPNNTRTDGACASNMLQKSYGGCTRPKEVGLRVSPMVALWVHGESKVCTNATSSEAMNNYYL